jgi:hypothetical protein
MKLKRETTHSHEGYAMVAQRGRRRVVSLGSAPTEFLRHQRLSVSKRVVWF